MSFIDYEYATPSPAAFDIANHFAEWAGYDCDFNKIPTQSVRKEFLTEYVKSYAEHSTLSGANQKDVVEKLFKDVDRFRGIPGFYWYGTKYFIAFSSKLRTITNIQNQQGCMGADSSENFPDRFRLCVLC